jgi:Glyoxalase-like domain
MTLELDHLFICTAVGAAEIDQLLRLGLKEGNSNSHPGQGTACRRIFFHNAYLEFLWVVDEQEARADAVRPLGLWERWRYRQTGYSPFGLGLRVQPASSTFRLPFQTVPYRPPYLPGVQVDVAANAVFPAEPLVFYLPIASRPDRYPAERTQPLQHPVGFREMSAVSITLPKSGLSDPLAALSSLGLVRWATGSGHLAEVIFDEGQRRQLIDCRPSLPLVLRW